METRISSNKIGKDKNQTRGWNKEEKPKNTQRGGS